MRTTARLDLNGQPLVDDSEYEEVRSPVEDEPP
jgi:hypothetical protein